jgi:hypothetical protein
LSKYRKSEFDQRSELCRKLNFLVLLSKTKNIFSQNLGTVHLMWNGNADSALSKIKHDEKSYHLPIYLDCIVLRCSKYSVYFKLILNIISLARKILAMKIENINPSLLWGSIYESFIISVFPVSSNVESMNVVSINEVSIVEIVGSFSMIVIASNSNSLEILAAISSSCFSAISFANIPSKWIILNLEIWIWGKSFFV